MTTKSARQLADRALSGVAWHISSYSENGGISCVEAGPFMDGTGGVAVRDSQHRVHGHLVFPGTEWAAFLRAVQQGEL